MLNSKYISLLTFYFYFYFCFSTISKSDKKKKSVSNKHNLFDIYDNGKLNYKIDILKKATIYSKNLINSKSFKNGSTLAYVTPWNNYGYDAAKIFANKFSFISPVWLSILYDGNDFTINGLHDIDLGWVSKIKMNNVNLKVVPRLLFEHWSTTNYIHVMKSEYISNRLTEKISEMLKKYHFDGVVLEIWLQIGAYFKQETIHFIQHMSYNFKEMKLLLMLAIPPPVYNGNNPGIFNGNDFSQLEAYVDYFSLMTYDYSSQNNPSGNAPIEWMKKCVQLLEPSDTPRQRAKILMGLNFYGYKYSYSEATPIIRHELIDILQTSQTVDIIWHKEIKEHEFKIRQKDGSYVAIWYPTVQSVDLRVKLAESLGVGLSIWEIGQGLDYFYDVL